MPSRTRATRQPRLHPESAVHETDAARQIRLLRLDVNKAESAYHQRVKEGGEKLAKLKAEVHERSSEAHQVVEERRRTFMNAVVTAVDEGEISLNELAEALGVSRARARQMYQIEVNRVRRAGQRSG